MTRPVLLLLVLFVAAANFLVYLLWPDPMTPGIRLANLVAALVMTGFATWIFSDHDRFR